MATDFQGRWSCFWATSFSLELELFDEYLFRRLGEPPLNATLLVDFQRLAHTLAGIGTEDSRLLRRANRDYLLRGVALGSGAFHPKTYFFGNRNEGVLLVGSGNLTLRGIEEGHELFARFNSREADDMGSIRGWRDWMDGLIARLGDRDLSVRWLDVKARCADWLNGDATSSCFVHNLDRSLLDQIAPVGCEPADELHVSAPFYDHRADALARLIERLEPKRLHVYLGGGTSVDGDSLAATLTRSKADSVIYRFEPHDFVHAKLFGVIRGGNGLLLSGSPNLSLAALAGSPAVTGQEWANVEAGVMVSTPAALVAASFQPHDLELREERLEGLGAYTFTTEEAALRLPLRLRAARLLPDRRVEVDVEPISPDELWITTGLEPQLLRELTSVEPVQLPEGGALAWICDADGEPLSNRVVLDEPARLRDWLHERTSTTERPQGLDPLDYDQPVGRMLQFLHERCIFDIDETDAAARARALANEDAAQAETNWDFLDELLKEELRLDPRSARYPLGGSGLPEDDEILALLRIMLDRTPQQRALHAVGARDEEEPPPDGTGTPWTPERRLQVRLFNVLDRWCGALSDPRFRWIDPAAPTRNFSALVLALYETWEQVYLPRERVERLLETLFGSYICTERSPGYLVSISDEERDATLARLSHAARVIAGALAYGALEPGGDWRAHIFDWQPFLVRALEHGVIEVRPRSRELVRRLIGGTTTAEQIEERLLWACDFIDDDHWCLKQERELGLPAVQLTKETFNPRFGITLSAPETPLDDPRLVALVRQALAYRRVDGAVVETQEGRLAVKLGEAAHALNNGTVYASPTRIDDDRLREMLRSGVSFARVLNIHGAVAS